MKKVLKFVGWFFGLIVVAVTILLIYVGAALPDVGEAEDVKIEYTPERLARGKYLATTVTVCVDCHSKRDFSKFSGPITDGTIGMGGDIFDQAVGMPGVFIAKNISHDYLSRYTDGELYRVITTGVSKEGKAMFPLMPYPYYGKMDPEDIYSIIAYVRSIPTVKNEVSPSTPDFPMNFIINTIPKKASPQKRPDKSDVLAYGAYMTNASGCVECHTQVDKGVIIPELQYGGGREFMFPDGSTVRSSNISPDPQTGIGNWSEEMFVNRFKQYADSSYVAETVAPGEFNTIMPWTMYGQMDRDDLAAIYSYLKTVKPQVNQVVKFSPKQK